MKVEPSLSVERIRHYLKRRSIIGGFDEITTFLIPVNFFNGDGGVVISTVDSDPAEDLFCFTNVT